MRTHDTPIAKLEQLEERLLLSVNPVGADLFDLASTVNLQAADSVLIGGQILAGQSEVYTFTAPASGNFQIDMTALGGDLDTMLQLYTESGRRSRGNDNANRYTLDSSVKLRVRPGQTYYLVATGKDGTSGDFNLTITSNPTDDHGNDNNSARAMRMRRGRAAGKGIVNYDGDNDMFKLTAEADGPLNFLLTGRNSRADFAPELTVFNAQGEQFDLDVSAAGDGLQMTILASAGETYFVRVSGGQGSRYRISAKQPTDDIGDTIATSTSIRMSRRGSGKAKGEINWAANAGIGLTGDVDMFDLVSGVTGSMTVGMSPSRGSSIDSYMYIYDSTGQLIAQDDNGGINYNALVTFDVVAGETYYIQAASANDASMGRYSLLVKSEVQAQPEPEPEPDPEPAPEPAPEPDPEPAPEPDPVAGVTPGESILAEVISVAQGLQLRVVGTDLADVITLS